MGDVPIGESEIIKVEPYLIRVSTLWRCMVCKKEQVLFDSLEPGLGMALRREPFSAGTFNRIARRMFDGHKHVSPECNATLDKLLLIENAERLNP